MTGQPPRVSVIMATWGRGRHILPSVRSVLAQDMADLELLVVGDATRDETEAAVRGLDDPRVRWLNLPARVGSQSGPNNAGIAAARGAIIAYLGHDDLWEPGHLGQVLRAFDTPGQPDFVVSGMIAHHPNGAPGSRVYGLIAADADKHRHHFPPGCLAHRKAVIARIGPWPMPQAIRAPIDVDFLARAVAADLRFATTGAITVHRFSAADRYLSYVRPAADEQEAMLRAMAMPDHAARVAAMIDAARRSGWYMREDTRDYSAQAPGMVARQSAARRGLTGPPLQPLGRGAVIRHLAEDGALDWQARPVLGVRRHRLNPRPRLLLPFAAGGEARLWFRAHHPDRAALGPLLMCCNGVAVTATSGARRPGVLGWSAVYSARIALDPEAPSLLEFRLGPALLRKHRLGPVDLGFGVGPLRLRPL